MSDIQTLATLVLGGAFDATELGENDIQPDSKLIEELQQRLVSGSDDVYIELVDRAHVIRLTAERDALQLLLNERDEQNHSLEQRRQAEQQACQSAERDAARYRFLRKVTPYRFKKMQDAATTDGGDVLYFHADRFDAAIDAAQPEPVSVVMPQDEKLMEIVERYPNGDPLEYDAALRQIKQ